MDNQPQSWLEVVQIIEEFLTRYPEAEFDFAHIVLSDYNLKDSHIDWCLTHRGEYRNTSKEVAGNTVRFLHRLKEIPESIRQRPD